MGERTAMKYRVRIDLKDYRRLRSYLLHEMGKPRPEIRAVMEYMLSAESADEAIVLAEYYQDANW